MRLFIKEQSVHRESLPVFKEPQGLIHMQTAGGGMYRCKNASDDEAADSAKTTNR